MIVEYDFFSVDENRVDLQQEELVTLSSLLYFNKTDESVLFEKWRTKCEW